MIKKTFAQFAADDSGVTSVEYGILGVLIAGAIVAAMITFRADLGSAFTNIGDKLSAPIA
jgi:Flp pilus assembly pilin Flp